MSRAPEHRVLLAALDQNAQLLKPSSAAALNTDPPASNGGRPDDNMDVDGAPGSDKEFAGQGTGTAAGGDPSHGSQAPALAAAPSLHTRDVLVSVVSIMQPLMTIIHDYGCNPRPVDQQTLDNLQQMLNTVKPHWKAVKKVVQTASTGKGPAAQAAGEEPSKQVDKNGSAKEHKAAEPPSQTAAMGQSALPAAASEQAVVEAGKRLADPWDSAAADRRLSRAAITSLQDPAPGEDAVTAADVLMVSLISSGAVMSPSVRRPGHQVPMKTIACVKFLSVLHAQELY